MLLEKDIEGRLTKGIENMGGLSLKWTSPGNDGVPDRILILPGGQVWFVELKTDSGRLSGRQKYQLTRLKGLGCKVRIIWGLKGLEELLDEIHTAQLSEESD